MNPTPTYRQTLPLHLHARATLSNIIATSMLCKLQPPYPYYEMRGKSIPIGLTPIYKQTLLLHPYAKATLYSIVATYLTCKL